MTSKERAEWQATVSPKALVPIETVNSKLSEFSIVAGNDHPPSLPGRGNAWLIMAQLDGVPMAGFVAVLSAVNDRYIRAKHIPIMVQ